MDNVLKKLVSEHERMVLRIVMGSHISNIAVKIIDIRSLMSPCLSSCNRIYIIY